MLESHLRLVKIQLQTLNAARRRLTNVAQERSRVIDLLCYAVPCTGKQNTFVRTLNFAPTECPSRPNQADLEPCAKSALFPVEPLGAFTNECDQAIEVNILTARISISGDIWLAARGRSGFF
jgi:hypothetical protein